MSTKNTYFVTEVLSRLKTAKNFKRDVHLAGFLEISANRLSTWKSRGNIDWWIILDKCNDISLNWLVRGKGPVLFSESDPTFDSMAVADLSPCSAVDSVRQIEYLERIIKEKERLLNEKERLLSEKERYIKSLEARLQKRKKE